MSEYIKTSRTTVKRGNKRATYDKETIHKILDEAILCHVATTLNDSPIMQPTIHWRIGEKLYIHGSSKNGLFAALKKGAEACITVTIMDGLVMARSAFHHSVNYRCVMVYSKADEITDPEEKLSILDVMMKKITPDRIDQIRGPNTQELKATSVLCFDLKEISAKVRTGPPVDDDDDLSNPVWAGVIPVSSVYGQPIDDPLWKEMHEGK